MSMKPRVLIVGHFPPAAGGITSFLLTILSSAITMDYELIPFNIGRPAKRNIINNTGYRVIINSGLRRAVIAIMLTIWHMITFPIIVLWHRPAIIHLHTAQFLVFWETTYYVFVSRALRVPCCLQFHASFQYFYEKSRPCLRTMILSILRRADVCALLCKKDVEFLREKSAGDIRCCYLPNFIQVRAIEESVPQVRKRAKRAENIVVLFLGGSEAAHKGLFDLLSAICILGRLQLGLRFHLIAVPREEVNCRLPADLLSCCEIRDWVSGATKIDIFARADIFVLPSYAEGMPIAILEAMACSLPVVATKVGGIPDLITEGQEGYLLEPGDIQGLARAISGLACDFKTRESMGRNGLHKAQTLHDVSVGVQHLQTLYEAMLEQTRHSFTQYVSNEVSLDIAGGKRPQSQVRE
jgi:glycosyltransferase involved in cell wall biosynthesis